MQHYGCLLSRRHVCRAGLIQPELLSDGQVCVDMGEPILEAEHIPTTLQPTQVSAVRKMSSDFGNIT